MTLHSFWANSSNRPINVTLCSIHWHGAGDHPPGRCACQRLPALLRVANCIPWIPTCLRHLWQAGFVGQDSAVMRNGPRTVERLKSKPCLCYGSKAGRFFWDGKLPEDLGKSCQHGQHIFFLSCFQGLNCKQFKNTVTSRHWCAAALQLPILPHCSSSCANCHRTLGSIGRLFQKLTSNPICLDLSCFC